MCNFKNRTFLTMFLKGIGLFSLIISLFIPFFPAITLNSTSISKTFSSGFNFIFGGSIKADNILYEVQGISVISLIAYILLLISALIIVLDLFTKQKKSNISIWLSIISILLIISSAIMFLCSHQSVANVLADALIKSHSDTVSQTIFDNSKLNFGIYGVSVFCFISSLTLITSNIKAKKIY